LFCAADEKQSLYSRNYSWTHAHPRLTFTGRTAILKRNYRSTAEIDRAAFDLLVAEEGEPLVESASVHSGPLPVLMRDVPDVEVAPAVASFVRQMAKHLRMKLSAAAVLVPTAEVGTRLASALELSGLPVKYFPGRDLDLSADVVKVITLHSAKGLEFPIVTLCGFEEGTYPIADDYDDAGEFDEKLRNQRRLLYVGMTRAMRGLLLVVNQGCTLEVFAALKPEHWHVGERQ
jgi:superfamily I DNA/RNA helicase